MQRFHQILFVVALLGLCWFAMQAVHELGHVIGAVLTGGVIERVVLHPLTISRTDVSPNPNPMLVVWLGPVMGCLVPVTAWLLVPRSIKLVRGIAMFFAGFCLVANGVYISVGAFEGIGDSGEILRSGSPFWMLLAFGAMTIPVGFWFWHRMGSLTHLLSDPAAVDSATAYSLALILVVLLIAGCLFG